jgi:hypothetical protein
MRRTQFLFRVCSLAAVTFVCMMLSRPAFASSPNYTQIGHNISIGPNERADQVTCVGCSIYIRGQVSGEATAVGGSIYVEDQGQVGGEVTVVAGDARLEKGVKVGGETTVVGGELRRDPEAQVGGEVTAIGGRTLGWVILFSPLLLLGLLVALIVWLVQRPRRPAIPAAA